MTTNPTRSLVSEASTWPTDGLREFLQTSLAMLNRYANTELGSFERRRAAIDMEHALAPLRFYERLEPRQTVSEAWRELHTELPIAFKEAVLLLLRRPRPPLTIAELHLLLTLLAASGANVNDDAAFVAFDMLARAPLDTDRSLAAAALVTAASTDGRSTISLLERLRREEIFSLAVFYSAARKLARWDPARLTILLALFGREALAEEDDIENLKFLICDLIDRAGSFTVLDAITQIDPLDCQLLYQAGFGEENPPFILRYVVVSGRGVHGVQIVSEQHEYDVSLFTGPSRDDEWLLKLRSVTGLIPELAIQRPRPATVNIIADTSDDWEPENRDEPSVASLAMRRLEISVAEV